MARPFVKLILATMDKHVHNARRNIRSRESACQALRAADLPTLNRDASVAGQVRRPLAGRKANSADRPPSGRWLLTQIPVMANHRDLERRDFTDRSW